MSPAGPQILGMPLGPQEQAPDLEAWQQAQAVLKKRTTPSRDQTGTTHLAVAGVLCQVQHQENLFFIV